MSEFVADHGGSVRLNMLADAQVRYRRTAAAHTVAVEARQFEAVVRRLDEDGEPLTLIVL